MEDKTPSPPASSSAIPGIWLIAGLLACILGVLVWSKVSTNETNVRSMPNLLQSTPVIYTEPFSTESSNPSPSSGYQGYPGYTPPSPFPGFQNRSFPAFGEPPPRTNRR